MMTKTVGEEWLLGQLAGVVGGVVVLGDVLELGGVVDELVAVESVVIMQHCCRYVSHFEQDHQ